MATKREGDWDYYEMTNDQDEVEFGMSGRNGFGTVTLVADADSDRLQMASRIYVSDKDVHPTLMMANAGEKRWILRDPSKGCARLEGIVYIPSTFRTFTFAVEALLHLRIAERAPGQPRLDLDKLDIEAGSVEPVFPSSTQSRRLHFSDALTAGDVRIGSFDRAELTGKLAIGGMATIGTVGDETHTDMELVFTAEGERTRSLWTFGGMGSARYDVHNEAGTHSLDVGHGNRGNLTLRYHEGQINGAFVYEERERQSIVGLGPPPVAFVGEVNKRRDRISFGIDGDEGWMDLRFK